MASTWRNVASTCRNVASTWLPHGVHMSEREFHASGRTLSPGAPPYFLDSLSLDNFHVSKVYPDPITLVTELLQTCATKLSQWARMQPQCDKPSRTNFAH